MLITMNTMNYSLKNLAVSLSAMTTRTKPLFCYQSSLACLELTDFILDILR